MKYKKKFRKLSYVELHDLFKEETKKSPLGIPLDEWKQKFEKQRAEFIAKSKGIKRKERKEISKKYKEQKRIFLLYLYTEQKFWEGSLSRCINRRDDFKLELSLMRHRHPERQELIKGNEVEIRFLDDRIAEAKLIIKKIEDFIEKIEKEPESKKKLIKKLKELEGNE